MSGCKHGRDVPCYLCERESLQAENARLTSEVARLNRCVVEYGKHSGLCVSVQLPVSSKGKCDCGFDQVIAAAAAAVVDAIAKP